MANDPIHQFQINKIVPIEIGGIDFSFTNASLFMVATVASAAGFLYFSTSQRSVVPGRAQSVAEMSYEFIANMLREGAGSHGMKFFPLVFSLFMFVLTANLLGMFPYFFTVTSQIIVTFALAILVVGTVIFYGFYKHGLHFLKLFVPSGVRGTSAAGGGDRSDFVPLASDLAFRSSVRQHAGRPYHPESVRGLRRLARSAWRTRHRWCHPAPHHDRRPDRSRIPRRLPPGLRLCGADLHVPQRRGPSRRALRIKTLAS